MSGIVRRLEQSGDQDIASEAIGEMVMDGLKQLDDVAFVRFASVYRDFRDARDFGDLIDELAASGRDGEGS